MRSATNSILRIRTYHQFISSYKTNFQRRYDQSLCRNKNKSAKSLYCTEWNNASCDSGARYHRYDPYCNAGVGYIDMIFTITLICLGRRVEFEFKAKILFNEDNSYDLCLLNLDIQSAGRAQENSKIEAKSFGMS